VGTRRDAGTASEAAEHPQEHGRDWPVTELTATACQFNVFLQLYFQSPIKYLILTVIKSTSFCLHSQILDGNKAI